MVVVGDGRRGLRGGRRDVALPVEAQPAHGDALVEDGGVGVEGDFGEAAVGRADAEGVERKAACERVGRVRMRVFVSNVDGLNFHDQVVEDAGYESGCVRSVLLGGD